MEGVCCGSGAESQSRASSGAHARSVSRDLADSTFPLGARRRSSLNYSMVLGPHPWVRSPWRWRGTFSCVITWHHSFRAGSRLPARCREGFDESLMRTSERRETVLLESEAQSG